MSGGVCYVFRFFPLCAIIWSLLAHHPTPRQLLWLYCHRLERLHNTLLLGAMIPNPIPRSLISRQPVVSINFDLSHRQSLLERRVFYNVLFGGRSSNASAPFKSHNEMLRETPAKRHMLTRSCAQVRDAHQLAHSLCLK